MEGLGTFAAAVFLNWLSLVTGAVGFGVYLLSKTRRIPDLPWRTLIRVWVATLLFASFQTWQNEHAAREADRARVEELKGAFEPMLRGNLRAMHLAEESSESGRPRIQGLFLAEILNEGQDSTAHRYRIALVINGRRYPGELLPLPTEALVVHEPLRPELTQVVSGKDDLRELTSAQPIKRGARVVGALWAWFGTVDVRLSDCTNATIELEAQDVKGHSFAFETQGAPKAVQGRLHLPGLTKQASPTDEIEREAGAPITLGHRPVDPDPN